MNKVFITDTFLQYIYHITSTQDTQQTLLHFPVQSQQQRERMIIHLKRPQNCICSNTHTAFDGAILRDLKISSDEREIGWNGEKCQYNNGRYENTGGCNKMSLSSCLVPHRFIGTRSTPRFCACFARSNKQRGSPILPNFHCLFFALCWYQPKCVMSFSSSSSLLSIFLESHQCCKDPSFTRPLCPKTCFVHVLKINCENCRQSQIMDLGPLWAAGFWSMTQLQKIKGSFWGNYVLNILFQVKKHFLWLPDMNALHRAVYLVSWLIYGVRILGFQARKSPTTSVIYILKNVRRMWFSSEFKDAVFCF